MDFKQILRQLEQPAAREMYDTITIDTVGLAWQMCEDFTCAQNGVQKIADIPWGGGYTACKKEFENSLRKITQLGYGLVVIAHVERRVEKRADDSEVEILGPAIPKLLGFYSEMNIKIGVKNWKAEMPIRAEVAA